MRRATKLSWRRSRRTSLPSSHASRRRTSRWAAEMQMGTLSTCAASQATELQPILNSDPLLRRVTRPSSQWTPWIEWSTRSWFTSKRTRSASQTSAQVWWGNEHCKGHIVWRGAENGGSVESQGRLFCCPLHSCCTCSRTSAGVDFRKRGRNNVLKIWNVTMIRIPQ